MRVPSVSATGGCQFSVPSGALGNGLKRLELAKLGFITHPMQNSMRNMTGTLFLMCGGLMMSKLRISDGPQAGISIWWASRFGGKFKSQMVLARNARNIIFQHVLVENGGRGVRVVP